MRTKGSSDSPGPFVNIVTVLAVAWIAYAAFTTPGGELQRDDWKTYRNERYGFELQYPNQWKVGEGSKYNHPANSISFLSFVAEPPVIVSVSTEKAERAVARVQKIIDEKFSYDYSKVFGVDVDTSKESDRYDVYNFTNAHGVKMYSYSFVGKYSETFRSFFFDTNNATIVVSVTSDVSCAKGCEFATENEAFLANPVFQSLIDSIKVLP